MNENTEKDDIIEPQPWELLDQVVRKWATMTGFENDQDNYAKLKRISDETND